MKRWLTRLSVLLVTVVAVAGVLTWLRPGWYLPSVMRLPFDAPGVPQVHQDHYWSERDGRAGVPVPGGTRPLFVDVRPQSGVDFVSSSPGIEADYLPQMKGGGILVLDVDGDGWEDLYFPDFSQRALVGEGRPGRPRLYRNLGGLRFADITAEAGLERDAVGYAGAAADVDRDGDQDLVLTDFGAIRTLLNDGEGRFEDASHRSGIAGSSFVTTAEFLDYDLDGQLDLVATSYGDWSREIDDDCKSRWQHMMAEEYETGAGKLLRQLAAPGSDEHPTVTGVVVPACLPASHSYLFRGLGDGRFEDVTDPSGIGEHAARGLGIAVMDLDGDRYPDVLVANDQSPTHLHHNLGDGRFEEIALRAGVAYDADGNAGSGMGIGAGYLLDDERICFAVGFYCGEETPLFCQVTTGDGQVQARFVDRSAELGPDAGTAMLVTFGVQALDYDLDGWTDLLAANGHSSRDFVIPGTPARQPCSVFQNLGGARFEEWVLPADEALGRPILGRGMAQADLDHDGDVDLVVTESGGPPMLLRNDTDRGDRHALLVGLRGRASNVEGLGADVVVECGGRRFRQYHSARSSFMARSSELMHFGLGDCGGEARIQVTWPGGQVDRHEQLPVDRAVRLTEGEPRAELLYAF